MNWRKIFNLLFAALLVLGLLPALALAQEGASPQAAMAQIEADLLSALEAEGSADFFVDMAEQADLSKATEIEDWDARGWYVYNTLREVANRTQAPVIEYAKENGLVYRSFFGKNTVYIEAGTLEEVQVLAGLPGVARLHLGEDMQIQPEDVVLAEMEKGDRAYGWNLDTLDPGNSQYGMQAAQVWDQFGVKGAGIVVANIDTGADYTHPALNRQYRGNLGGGNYDHDYNWYQPYNVGGTCGDGTYPCDWQGHGSGTAGIMVGETADLTEQIGIAPQAQWMACMGCESPPTGCSTAALQACMDWMLAPTDTSGNSPDPSKRPHIVNNSWGGGGCGTTYQTYVQAWVAAGMFPAFSAGNTTACSAVGSPGDNPESFGTAAHRETGTNLYAGGPSCFYPTPSCDAAAHEVDPHINSPTYGRTSNNAGGYYLLSGTSGASPHTAGAVALIWSGNPSLVGQLDQTFTILEQSANTDVPAGSCGEPACAVNNVPNYEYGWGYLDALAAVTMAGVGGQGWLDGTVTEAFPLDAPGDPLAGIQVTAERAGGGNWLATTDASGYYTLTLVNGTYTVTAEGTQYEADMVAGIVIVTDTVHTQNFSLVPKGFLHGYVTDADSAAPLEATITISPTGEVANTDPATGYYTMYLNSGAYDVLAEATDYASQTVAVNISNGATTQQDFQLLAAIAIVPDPIAMTLELGTTGSVGAVMTNNMVVDYPFEFVEVGAAPAMALAAGDVLLLGDDVDATGWQTYRDALTAAGVTWDEWNLDSLSFPTAGDLAPYSAIVVFDESSMAYGDADCQTLADWLVSGGKSMFATSVDWLWDLENGTVGQGEHNLYLLFNSEYQGDYSGTAIGELVGVPGDDIGGSFAPPNTIALVGASDSSGDYVDEALSTAVSGLTYGTGGTGSGYSALTHYEDATYKTVWLGVNMHNGLTDQAERDELMANIMGFFLGGDVSWYGTDIVSGTVTAGTNLGWTNFFTATPAAGVTQPGLYEARLRVKPTMGGLPTKEVDLQLTVTAPADWGVLEGTVTSNRPGGPLEAGVVIEAGGGVTYPLTTDPATGYYSFWLQAGTYTVTASADGYISEMAVVGVTGMATTTQDFELELDAGWIDFQPPSMSKTLDFGLTATQAFTISNLGPQPLDWELGEQDKGFTPILVGLEDVDGLQILADNSHGSTMGSYDDMLADLLANGATVDILDVGPIDAALLSNYDVLWVHDSLTIPFTASELNDIEAWVYGGGGLFINYDCCDDTTAPVLSALFDITYLGYSSGGGGVTTNIYPHPITEGVTQLNFPSPYQSLAVAGTAEVVVEDVVNNPQIAANDVGGKVVVVDEDAFNDGTYWTYDAALLARNIFGWLGASDVAWLSEDPISGTVPAYSTFTGGEVTFDSGVVPEPGIYMANLRVRNNDPLAASVIVPVTMTVQPTADTGKLQGTVTSDRPGGPLEADILIEDSMGMTWTTTSDPDTGYYYRWLLTGTYTVTASAPGYLVDSAQVQIVGLAETTQDFELVLNAPEIGVSPASMEEVLVFGDTAIQMLTISNTGVAPLNFEIQEADLGMVPALHIPPFTGELPQDDAPDSFGPAPASQAVDLPGPTGVVINGAPAFGFNLGDDGLYSIPDVDAPGSWSSVGSPGAGSWYAGDFAMGDFGTLYAIENDTQQLYAVDTATGAGTLIGASPSLAGQTWTGMSFDFTTGVMYGSATDGTTATLFTIDLNTGATTQVGTISGYPYTIDIAIGAGGQLYGVDISAEEFIAIDKSTGAATSVGALGFVCNYAQGLDYDEVSGLMYWAAYSGTAGELRLIDTTTGASTSVGAFAGGAEVDAFAIATGGAGGEVPWLSESPISATVPAFSSLQVSVLFDSGAVPEPGTYLANLNIISDDPFEGSVSVPVTMTVQPSADIGKVEGTVIGTGYCDGENYPLEADVVIESSSGMTWTTSSDPATGYYYRWLESGTYTLTFSANEHLSTFDVAQVTAQQTTTLDVAMRWIESCMDIAPPSFSLTVPVNTVFTDTLSIINDGAGPLMWELRETTATIALKDLTGRSDYPSMVAGGADPTDAYANAVSGSPTILDGIESWGNGTAMPGAGRYRAASVSDDCNRVWVLGGGGGPNDVMYYDSTTDAWTTGLAPIPNGAQNWQAVYIDGKIYLPGGYTTVHNNWLQIYDIATDSWTAGANMPSATTPMAAAVDGILYVFGGNPGPSANVAKYDPATDTWTAGLAPMPTASSYGRAIAAGGYAYVVGGAVPTGAFQRYDPLSDSWSVGPSLPVARGDMSLFLVGDYLYAEGGISDYAVWNGLTTVERYYLPDFPGGAWETMAAAPDAFGAAAYACASDKMWSVGGQNAAASSVTTNRYDDEGLPCQCGPGGSAWIDVPWVSEVPTDGLTLPYDAFGVDVVFDTNGLTIGECYTAALGLFHDDPGWDSPTMIPLELCVQSNWPVFGITKTVEAPNPYPGQTVTYTVAFGNDGDAVVGVNVTDVLPPEVEFAWADSGKYYSATHELVWSDMALGAGEWMTATVVVTIRADTTPGLELMNMVYLSWFDQEHSAGAPLDVQQPPEPFLYYYLPMIYKGY